MAGSRSGKRLRHECPLAKTSFKLASMNDGAFGAQKVFQAGNNINQHYTIIDAKEIHIV